MRAGVEDLSAGSLVSRFRENAMIEQYDIIILNNLLEHVFDPYSFLTEIKSLLTSPTGLIVGSIPCGDDVQIKILRGFAWTIFAPFHRVLISLKGINLLLHRSDYSNLQIETSNVQWGWTRGIAWRLHIPYWHANSRKNNRYFRLIDYGIDLGINKIFRNNRANIFFMAKPK